MEKEMATHSSILAWKILWTEVPGRLQTMGSQRIRNNWVCTHKHTHRHTKTEDVEHILMCLLATCIYSLVLWCSVCKIFCPFLCDCLSVADLYSFFMYSWCKSFINSINFKYILQKKKKKKKTNTSFNHAPFYASFQGMLVLQLWDPIYQIFIKLTFWGTSLRKLKETEALLGVLLLTVRSNKKSLIEAPVFWPPDAKNWLTGKDSDAGKDWRQEEETTEDEMIGWHHRLDGHEFEQALGVGDGQRSLVCCSPWVHKELDMTEQLNWTELNLQLEFLLFLSINLLKLYY